MLFTMNRRSFLKRTATASLAFGSGLAMPAIVRAQARPVITHGLQSGDVNASSAMIWARVDRPAQMLVEVATTDSFKDAVKLARLLGIFGAIGCGASCGHEDWVAWVVVGLNQPAGGGGFGRDGPLRSGPAWPRCRQRFWSCRRR